MDDELEGRAEKIIMAAANEKAGPLATRVAQRTWGPFMAALLERFADDALADAIGAVMGVLLRFRKQYGNDPAVTPVLDGFAKEIIDALTEQSNRLRHQ